MVKEVFNYFMIASVIIGFIFIITTLQSKRAKDNSIVYLNLVVLFFTLNNLQIVLIDNFFQEANFFIRNMLLPFYALIVPAFYTFISYYLNVERKITSFVAFSTALFLVELINRIVFFKLYYEIDDCYIVAKYSQIEEIFNALFSLFLFVKSIQLLFNKTKLYSYTASYDNVKWLKKFLFLGSLILMTWIGAIVFNIDEVLNPQIFIYYPLRLSSSLLLFWLGYQGVFNYSLMYERIKLREAISNELNNIDEELKTNSKSSKFQIIKNHIENNKNYLNPNYSLELLSSELKISVSSLSKTINDESGFSFSDYINSLRVEKAKQLLASEDFKEYTILSIGLECGFNSKSTFYLAFKKFTNTTPTDFRKQNS